MRFFTTTIISALAAFASAYTQPDYTQSPEGNAFSAPGLNQIVPVGKPFTIEWDPTTEGPISLVLLRGPSSNVQPLHTLAENIDNSGKYEWTPSTTLEPDTTHYGLLLVVEGTGQYQWSTQFGISNPDYNKKSSSASSSAPVATITSTSTSAGPSSTEYVSYEITTTVCPESKTSVTATATPFTTFAIPASSTKIPWGTTLRSSSVASGTPSSAAPSNPLFTGAADRKAVGFGAVAVGVVAALVL